MNKATRRSARHNFIVGTACAAAAALGYSAANTCLRAVTDCDAMWVACVKAWPTALLMGPWIAVQYVQGRARWTTPGVIALLVVGALIGQAGNVFYQVSLEQVGLALATPLSDLYTSPS